MNRSHPYYLSSEKEVTCEMRDENALTCDENALTCDEIVASCVFLPPLRICPRPPTTLRYIPLRIDSCSGCSDCSHIPGYSPLDLKKTKTSYPCFYLLPSTTDFLYCRVPSWISPPPPFGRFLAAEGGVNLYDTVSKIEWASFCGESLIHNVFFPHHSFHGFRFRNYE